MVNSATQAAGSVSGSQLQQRHANILDRYNACRFPKSRAASPKSILKRRTYQCSVEDVINRKELMKIGVAYDGIVSFLDAAYQLEHSDRVAATRNGGGLPLPIGLAPYSPLRGYAESITQSEIAMSLAVLIGAVAVYSVIFRRFSCSWIQAIISPTGRRSSYSGVERVESRRNIRKKKSKSERSSAAKQAVQRNASLNGSTASSAAAGKNMPQHRSPISQGVQPSDASTLSRQEGLPESTATSSERESPVKSNDLAAAVSRKSDRTKLSASEDVTNIVAAPRAKPSNIVVDTVSKTSIVGVPVLTPLAGGVIDDSKDAPSEDRSNFFGIGSFGPNCPSIRVVPAETGSDSSPASVAIAEDASSGDGTWITATRRKSSGGGKNTIRAVPAKSAAQPSPPIGGAKFLTDKPGQQKRFFKQSDWVPVKRLVQDPRATFNCQTTNSRNVEAHQRLLQGGVKSKNSHEGLCGSQSLNNQTPVDERNSLKSKISPRRKSSSSTHGTLSTAANRQFSGASSDLSPQLLAEPVAVGWAQDISVPAQGQVSIGLNDSLFAVSHPEDSPLSVQNEVCTTDPAGFLGVVSQGDTESVSQHDEQEELINRPHELETEKHLPLSIPLVSLHGGGCDVSSKSNSSTVDSSSGRNPGATGSNNNLPTLSNHGSTRWCDIMDDDESDDESVAPEQTTSKLAAANLFVPSSSNGETPCDRSSENGSYMRYGINRTRSSTMGKRNSDFSPMFLRDSRHSQHGYHSTRNIQNDRRVSAQSATGAAGSWRNDVGDSHLNFYNNQPRNPVDFEVARHQNNSRRWNNRQERFNLTRSSFGQNRRNERNNHSNCINQYDQNIHHQSFGNRASVPAPPRQTFSSHGGKRASPRESTSGQVSNECEERDTSDSSGERLRKDIHVSHASKKQSTLCKNNNWRTSSRIN